MNDSLRRDRKVKSVLFVCEFNAIRSPIAEALARHFFGETVHARSAGVRKGRTDDMALAVLEEMGINLSSHKPQTLIELRDSEGLNFDLIITLSPEAHHAALEMTRSLKTNVEYWPTFDPTAVTGSHEREMEAYRQVRDSLAVNIRQRLSSQPLWSEETEL